MPFECRGSRSCRISRSCIGTSNAISCSPSRRSLEVLRMRCTLGSRLSGSIVSGSAPSSPTRTARAAEACLGEARGARARGSEREGSSILRFMNEAVIGRLREELAGLREQGLYKTERVLASPQGGVVRAGDRDVINLCANNYLGL